MSKGTILITGASSGLGEEMARQFAALGYDLALCARRTERLEALQAEIVADAPRRDGRAQGARRQRRRRRLPRCSRSSPPSSARIDRVIINAGLGKGAPLGTGRYDANKADRDDQLRRRARPDRGRDGDLPRPGAAGHLVMISSVSAMRGMRKTITTYAATKAGVAALAEGLLNENVKAKGIDVSIIYPGYIRSEMNEKVAQKTKFMVDTETGVKAMVNAIEKRKEKALRPGLAVGAARLRPEEPADVASSGS